MTIEREVNGYRFVETNRGDTLQAIALRELGDGARWPELVSFNKLLPPFLTDDPAQVRPGVVLTGKLIRVPAADPLVETTVDADLVFERDISLGSDGALISTDGDFGMVAGIDNLRQAIAGRLTTDRGELAFHPAYGSMLRRIVGTVAGPTAAILAAAYANSTVKQDPRISSVKSSVATVTGDRVVVALVAEPIVGRAVDVNQTI